MITSRAGETAVLSALSTAEAARLLEAAGAEAILNQRIEYISRNFVGKPYVENSLIGGPETPEVLTVSLEAFDCVTYIETVLALAFSRSISSFITALREMRYEGGEVEWQRRNHYMIDWARNNEVRGFIRDLTRGSRTVEKTRNLDSIKGLPPTQATFRCFPRQRLQQVLPVCETGDLMLFASTKRWLDVFHVGVLIKHEKGYAMRHATRTAGCVIEQDLSEFIRKNRMSGFMLLRPVQPLLNSETP